MVKRKVNKRFRKPGQKISEKIYLNYRDLISVIDVIKGVKDIADCHAEFFLILL